MLTLLELVELIITVYLLWTIFKIIRFIFKNFLRSRLNLKERYGVNSWVVVTGATDGLGKVYCEEFARDGFNIILVSRTLDKLNRVAKEIENKYNVKTHVVKFDFSLELDINSYTKAFSSLLDKFDISILINNIGVIGLGLHKNVSLESDYKTAVVNTLPQTLLTKIFSSSLSKRYKRSAVIDISSFASLMPFIKHSNYCATKSFNLFLSRALAEEYENYNIDFLSVKPFFIKTPMTDNMEANNLTVLTPEQVVNGSLNDLGYEKETSGHWIHKISYNFMGYVPTWLVHLIQANTGNTKTTTKA